MSDGHAHPIFQPLLNAISRPPKTMRVACYACFGTGHSTGSMSYGSNVETYGGPCSRCGGEKTIEVRI